MSALPVAPRARPGPPPSVDTRTAALVETLRGERQLLADLAEVLERQRHAVAAHDLAPLEDAAFAAHRILPNLAQARRRRRTLVHLLGGGEERDVPLSEMVGVLGATATDEVRAAAAELRETALHLAEELRLNRGVLEGALAAGDRLIRALCGAGQPPAVYRPGDAPAAAPADAGGRLLDRQA